MRTSPLRRPAFVILPLIAMLLLMISAVSAVNDCGIFVSATNGTNSATCGLNPAEPCATINFAQTRATQESLDCLFVQSGSYQETVVLQDGINIIGGYDASWVYDTYDLGGHLTQIIGGFSPTHSQFVSVYGSNLSLPTSLSNLQINTVDAAGVYSNSTGRSSHGIMLLNCADVLLDGIKIIAGNGSNGANGNHGANAGAFSATSGMHGSKGGNADSYSSNCSTNYTPGGANGINPAATSRNASGGIGGKGGSMDTSCGTFGFCSNCNARPGTSGSNASYANGSRGIGGFGSGPCANQGGNGTPGYVQNGSAGPGGSTGGIFSLTGSFVGRNGAPGSIGLAGGGGGGGGGSGGCDTGVDDSGAGGGGGGAGGMRAQGGGSPGFGGGSSICVYLYQTTCEVNNCTLTSGNGGNGGAGGNGGQGQAGGLGGAGGFPSADSAAGGRGGDGAHGGHGGGGGGGSGGNSLGIYANDSFVVDAFNSYAIGNSGAGGNGGISAPSAPASIDDGNDGGDGSLGFQSTIFLSSPKTALASSSSTASKRAACDPAVCLATAVEGSLPGTAFSFKGAFPNPMDSSTQLYFSLPASMNVKLDVYDIRGRKVANIHDGPLPQGEQVIGWSGRSNSGSPVAAGVYWVRLQAGSENALTRKITLIR